MSANAWEHALASKQSALVSVEAMATVSLTALLLMVAVWLVAIR